MNLIARPLRSSATARVLPGARRILEDPPRRVTSRHESGRLPEPMNQDNKKIYHYERGRPLAGKSVSDLAGVVDHYLRNHGVASPGKRTLLRLFETIYMASLKTEEGKPLQLRVALVNPSNRDPDPPPRPRPSR